MNSIHYLFRKPQSGFHSVENVFREIIPLVGDSFEIRENRLPESCASPGCLFRNLSGFQKTAGTSLYHITGHINYMALRTGRNTVLTVHDIQSLFTGNIFLRFIKLVFWFWIPCWIVRKITVISESTLEELRALVPFAGRKAVVVPNPVHPDLLFTPPKDNQDGMKVRILLVGTKANKNVERAAEALQGMPVRLHILGKLTAAQRKLLEHTRIEYRETADIPREEVLQCYRDCDLLLFPSLYEGFGMPIIEAQATGRPVVTSDRGAMKETAGQGACLVDPEDVASIRAGVMKVLADEDYAMQLVEKGLENVNRFRAEEVAERYMEVYRDIMDSKTGKAKSLRHHE